ncbi:MAG: ferrous iron transporter B [Candidatus Borkfalkiaceae bacterium]|nr:ferrous iron transporter B [Christensenellaceae bacterium]
MKRFALAGNPNCGKTTLFNSLTGSTAHVGNWPGVTVDKRDGVYKKCAEPIAIVDLPGIYSLSPYTPEEVIARNYVLEEKPDCVINIVDATNLERNLYLSTQIMEIDVPMVIALNMMDAVEKAGDKIDAKLLEERLGVPVVKISALKETGLKELMDKAYNESKKVRKGVTVMEGTSLSHVIGDVKIALEGQNVANPLFHAIKLVEGDEIEVKMHKETLGMVAAFKKTFNDSVFGSDFEAMVADARYKYISKNFAPVVTYKNKDKLKMTPSDKADKVLTHKVWGIPIFLVILFLIFHLTFSENLFFLNGFTENQAWMPSLSDNEIFLEKDDDGNVVYEENDDGTLALDYLTDDDGNYVNVTKSEGVTDNGNGTYSVEGENGEFYADADGNLGSKISLLNYGARWLATIYDGTLYSPGVVVNNVWNDMIVGELFDLVKTGVDNLKIADWATGLINDGIIEGLAAVLSFLPPILVLFLFFSILEDSGYMARIAFILDRMFRKFGLSGRAFMPMIMGFGCSVPAMINTRTLADEKERTATVRVIPFFSCGAKLPILTAVAGALVLGTGMNADLITYSMYLLGIVTAIVTVLLMRNTSLKGETPPFIMELPAYHAPQFKNLMAHLWDKTKHFVKKAFTIILASTILIWVLTHFDFSWHLLPDQEINQSILAQISKLVQPLFTPLGFGSQLGEYGWVFVLAAVSGLIAKENVISTFGTLAACLTAIPAVAQKIGLANISSEAGVGAVKAMIAATGISNAGLLAFIAFNMTTIPCFAAVATAKAELQDKNRYRRTLLFWLATSYVVAAMIYTVGIAWWTSFIWAAVIAAVVTIIVLRNKKAVAVRA